jgi:hypothetical protein
MRSPLDENNFLSKNYQRHHHGISYNLRALFCNARRCWRLSSMVLLVLAGFGMMSLGGYMARSKTDDNILHQSSKIVESNSKTPAVKEAPKNYRSLAVKEAFVHGIFCK